MSTVTNLSPSSSSVSSSFRRPNFPTLSPYILVKDAKAAIAFYEKILGAKLKYQLTDPSGGIIHAELFFGESVVMLSEEQPQYPGPLTLGGTPTTFCLYVDHCDAVIKKAIEEGATLEREAENKLYGDRAGAIIDPFGHKWMIQSFIEEIAPEVLQQKMEEMCKNNKCTSDAAQ